MRLLLNFTFKMTCPSVYKRCGKDLIWYIFLLFWSLLLFGDLLITSSFYTLNWGTSLYMYVIWSSESNLAAMCSEDLTSQLSFWNTTSFHWNVMWRFFENCNITGCLILVVLKDDWEKKANYQLIMINNDSTHWSYNSSTFHL